MKVALYGNVCNNMYAIAKALRALSGYDVHLYLPQNADFNNLPENDDPELKDNYPCWIHRGPEYNLGSALRFWSRNLVRELARYDLVILSSLAVALAPLLKGPRVVFFVTGGDLTVLPFKEIHRTLLYGGKSGNLKPALYQWLQRRGIKSCHTILSQPFAPFVRALEKLKVEPGRVHDGYFPIVFDTERFRLRDDAWGRVEETVRRELSRFSFRIFHPSRIVMDPHPHLVETGQCKRNDLLVEAFARFVKARGAKDAGLYLVDRSYGLDRGVAQLKRVIAEQGVEEQVVWLAPGNRKGFTRDQLVDLYSLSDLVADDFGAGWFGSICVEGFSCSKPVLSYVDEEAMKKMYRWHPFLSAPSAQGNAELIEKCYRDREFARSQGELGRKWALEHHSHHNAGAIYLRQFQRLLEARQPKPLDTDR